MSIYVLTTRPLWCSVKVPNRSTDLWEVLEQQIVVPPFVAVVFVQPACQLRRCTDRHDKPHQLARCQIDIHSLHDGRLTAGPGSCDRFFATGRSPVIDGVNHASVYRAKRLPELLRHVGTQESLWILQALLTSLWVYALWYLNASGL